MFAMLETMLLTRARLLPGSNLSQPHGTLVITSPLERKIGESLKVEMPVSANWPMANSPRQRSAGPPLANSRARVSPSAIVRATAERRSARL